MRSIIGFIRLKCIGRARFFRTFFWSQLFGSFGKDSSILGPITVKNPENIYMGKCVSLNPNVTLSARSSIYIGDYVQISTGVIINTGGLDYFKKGKERIETHNRQEVKIENGVWIGSGAIINPGVTIGENSVIGAGSVVTKNIQANVVAVGNPAHVIKEIP